MSKENSDKDLSDGGEAEATTIIEESPSKYGPHMCHFLDEAAYHAAQGVRLIPELRRAENKDSFVDDIEMVAGHVQEAAGYLWRASTLAKTVNDEPEDDAEGGEIITKAEKDFEAEPPCGKPEAKPSGSRNAGERLYLVYSEDFDSDGEPWLEISVSDTFRLDRELEVALDFFAEVAERHLADQWGLSLWDGCARSFPVKMIPEAFHQAVGMWMSRPSITRLVAGYRVGVMPADKDH